MIVSLQAAARRAALAVLTLVAACAGPGPVEWQLPVPEGTPTLRHDAVALEARSETIFLEEDLVIGDRDAPEELFSFLVWIGVDEQGRIHVLDAQQQRIQVFDAAGELLRSLGGEGQGPGELERPRFLSVGQGQVVVQDNGRQQFSVWNTEGEHVGDHGSLGYRIYRPFVPVADDRFVGRRTLGPAEVDAEDVVHRPEIVATVELETGTEELLVELPPEPIPQIIRGFPGGGTGTRPVRVPWARNHVVLSQAGAAGAGAEAGSAAPRVVVSLGAEYQLFAFDLEGEMLWALHVPWPREPITDAEVEEGMQDMREEPVFADARPEEAEIPTHKPAIEGLLTDGDGNLYVLPYHEGAAGDPVPVDVYSPRGEHLFSGWIERGWEVARGEHVYGRGADDAGDVLVVRYRLGRPFQ